jgi:cytochrome c-type biogenesis protein CcmH
VTVSERIRSVLASRTAWALLVLTAGAALAVGSVHGGPHGASARIANLDSIIKCPSCEDLSIAQSQASTAVALRAFVAAGVEAGESDTQIEDAVVARYGPGILLQPKEALVWVLPAAGIGVAALLLGAALWRRRRGQGAAPDQLAQDDDDLVAVALADRRGTDGDPA